MWHPKTSFNPIPYQVTNLSQPSLPPPHKKQRNNSQIVRPPFSDQRCTNTLRSSTKEIKKGTYADLENPYDIHRSQSNTRISALAQPVVPLDNVFVFVCVCVLVRKVGVSRSTCCSSRMRKDWQVWRACAFETKRPCFLREIRNEEGRKP